MSLKIFLTSDIHLGMRFLRYADIREDLVLARFETLANMVAMANEENCQIFAVAGDLFDRLNIPSSQIKQATEILNRFGGGPVLLLPGNHDHLTSNEKDLWLQMQRYAADHLLFLTEMQPYHLDGFGLDVCVYPAPCDKKHSAENHIHWVSRMAKRSSHTYHIGMAHGSLAGFSPDIDGRYYPMTEEQLLQCRLDLWFLGHTHKQFPDRENVGSIFFPATPEPDGFQCEHSGKAWLVAIAEDKTITTRSLSTGKYRFVDCTQAKAIIYQSIAKMRDFLDSFLERAEYTLLRIDVKGRIARDELYELQELRDKYQETFFYLSMDFSALQALVSQEQIAVEFSQNSFAYRLLSQIPEEQAEDLQIAYSLLEKAKF
ncbi:MAG: DNA repair exonuclease [Spirochaetota bacterium]